jgi:hypothetical protein
MSLIHDDELPVVLAQRTDLLDADLVARHADLEVAGTQYRITQVGLSSQKKRSQVVENKKQWQNFLVLARLYLRGT